MDGRQDRDECAKPIVGRASNLSDGIVAVFSLVRFQEKEMRKALQGNNRSGVCMMETRMKTHDCSRQGRQGRGGRFDIVPNVEMFLDPWKVGGSLTFRHYAECRNEGLGEEWAFITAHYDVVPNVEMRSRSPADVLGGWVR